MTQFDRVCGVLLRRFIIKRCSSLTNVSKKYRGGLGPEFNQINNLLNHDIPFCAQFEGVLNRNLSFGAQFEGVYDRQEGRRRRRPYTYLAEFKQRSMTGGRHPRFAHSVFCFRAGIYALIGRYSIPSFPALPALWRGGLLKTEAVPLPSGVGWPKGPGWVPFRITHLEGARSIFSRW